MDLKQKPIKHLSKSAWIMFLAMNAGFVVDYVYLSGPRQGPPAVGTPDSG